MASEFLQDFRLARNQVALKTAPGHASSVAVALEDEEWPREAPRFARNLTTRRACRPGATGNSTPFAAVASEFPQDVRLAQNQVVLKTAPGHASSVAVALDDEEWPRVAGLRPINAAVYNAATYKLLIARLCLFHALGLSVEGA